MKDLFIMCEKNELTQKQIISAFEQAINDECLKRADYKIKIASSGDFVFAKCAAQGERTLPEPFVDRDCNKILMTGAESHQEYFQTKVREMAGGSYVDVTDIRGERYENASYRETDTDYCGLWYGIDDGKFNFVNGAYNYNEGLRKKSGLAVGKIEDRFITTNNNALLKCISEEVGKNFEGQTQIPHFYFSFQNGNHYNNYFWDNYGHCGQPDPKRYDKQLTEEYVKYLQKEHNVSKENIDYDEYKPKLASLNTSKPNAVNMEDVLAFARKKHEGQLRKNGKDPYIVHPVRVSETIREVMQGAKDCDTVVAAALLHDTMEDTDTSALELEKNFGRTIAGLVVELTSATSAIDYFSKTKYLSNKMLDMTPNALTIKLADRLDNITDYKGIPKEKQQAYVDGTMESIGLLTEQRDLTKEQTHLIEKIIESQKKAALLSHLQSTLSLRIQGMGAAAASSNSTADKI